MNLPKLIEELRMERDTIADAIAALERLLPADQRDAEAERVQKRPRRPPESRKDPA
jgi:hypothetical protein